MSLKVWLPLNGTLENKGCADVTFTGTPQYKDGKIGQYALSLKSAIGVTCPSIANLKTLTVCFWGMSEASSTLTGNWQDLIGFSDVSSGGTNGTFRWETGYDSAPGIHWHDNATNAFVNGSCTHTNKHGEWRHCCVVFDFEKGKLFSYTDGALVATHTHAGGHFNSSGYFYLGQTNVIEGRITDVRIYDNALSAAEVHEIAQGLVCHVKLDEGNKNLLNSFYKAYTPTAYNAYQLSMTENMVSGGTYTIQLWDVTVSHSAKADSALGVYVYWGGGSVSLCSWSGSAFVNGHADYLSKTFTISSSQASGSGATNLWLNLYNSVPSASGTMNMKIGGWKLEKGSVATSYTNVSDATIHDSSGYGHNGTVTGAPTYVSDTVRNTTSLRFTATSHKCVLSNLNTSAFGNSYSIAWWGKCSSFSNLMQWGFSDGIRLNGVYNGTLWNTGDGSNNPLYTPGTTTQVTAPTTGAWHHFVMTGDGTTCKVYKDGVHWATAKTYKAISGSTIYLNGWDSGTSYSNSDLYLSDFRIYATALSAADIKVLYETDVRVASKKDIQAYAFNEAGSRELLSGAKLTTAYSEKNAMYTGYTNGEIVLTGNSSIGSEYIDVFPTGKTYRWDAVITKDASNTFYLGFERYDASKTSRSNNACVYVISDSTAWTRKHVSGTVDLSTDTVNACRFIALRILNDWSSANNRKATIHSVSLREITTAQTPTIQNTGVFLLDELKEDAKAAFYKNGFVEATEFIET